MTTPFGGGTGRNTPGLPNLPTPPTGWPVGSFATYEEAQKAVDYLADNEFPVSDVTIVGVDLMLVERVLGRLTWGRVLGNGAASGIWMGLFVGALLAYFERNSGALIVGWWQVCCSACCSPRSATRCSAAGATSPRPAR